jgi:hypothetical protein
VNDEFEFNLNKLLSDKWEIYKMYHDRVIMFKEFLNENELEQFDALKLVINLMEIITC